MTHLYSPSTGCCYFEWQTTRPDDCIVIDDETFQQVLLNPAPGKVRAHDPTGKPYLTDAPPHTPSVPELCARIDTAAAAARYSVVGDPLRAIEYERAAAEAQAFANAGYAGPVPPSVAAWAISGRTAQQAADDILEEASQYNTALEHIRTLRLAGKEQIRTLMAAGDVEQAQTVADQTVTAINAAVAGIGNNAG